MKLQNNRSWFTLIELLVVITIIGILATGAVWIYTSQIQKARDSTRITSLNALKWAVEQVYQDTFEYPHSDRFAAEVAPYIENIPSDPKHSQPCNNTNWDTDCWFAYIPQPDANSILFGSYELSTAFENKWNVNSTAKDGDNWNDDTRLEIGSLTSSNDTSVALDSINSTGQIGACTQAWAEASNPDEMVIINWNPSDNTASQCG